MSLRMNGCSWRGVRSRTRAPGTTSLFSVMPYCTPRLCRSHCPLASQVHCRQRAASAWAAFLPRPFSTSPKDSVRLAAGVAGIAVRLARSAAMPIFSQTGLCSASRSPSSPSLGASAS